MFIPGIIVQAPLLKRLSAGILLVGCCCLLSIPARLHASPEGVNRVVIDPGHGGKDPGCISPRAREKNIVLSVGLKLGAMIEKELPDVEVIYTRKTDIFIPLKERANIANKNQADLFISIHANSLPANTSSSRKRSIKGAETYVMGNDMAEQNIEVAQLENSAIFLEDDYSSHYEGFDPKSPESYIIFQLMQNSYLKQSLEMAEAFQHQVKVATPIVDRGVKQAGFVVLYKTAAPSVLVELGYMSNPDDERYLNTAAGQEKMAKALFEAFRTYKNRIENKSNFVAEVKPTASTESPAAVRQESPERVPAGSASSINPGQGKEDIWFYVQIAAAVSSKPIALKPANFKGETDVTEIRGTPYNKYLVGKTTSYPRIEERLRSIRKKYPDAFITATRNGNFIPPSEARSELNQRR